MRDKQDFNEGSLTEDVRRLLEKTKKVQWYEDTAEDLHQLDVWVEGTVTEEDLAVLRILYDVDEFTVETDKDGHGDLIIVGEFDDGE